MRVCGRVVSEKNVEGLSIFGLFEESKGSFYRLSQNHVTRGLQLGFEVNMEVKRDFGKS